jgi:PAS domain-containing protein
MADADDRGQCRARLLCLLEVLLISALPMLPLTLWAAGALADHSRGELILLACTLLLRRLHRQNARLKAQVRERTTALQESEERFRAVVEGSLAGILVHRETTPLFANTAYARAHGYQTADQILAMDSVIPLIAPHDRERMLGHHTARTGRQLWATDPG